MHTMVNRSRSSMAWLTMLCVPVWYKCSASAYEHSTVVQQAIQQSGGSSDRPGLHNSALYSLKEGIEKTVHKVPQTHTHALPSLSTQRRPNSALRAGGTEARSERSRSSGPSPRPASCARVQ